MQIRPLQWSDFHDFVELYYSRFEELERDPEFGLGGPPTKPTLGEEAAWFGEAHKSILDGKSIYLVAEEGGHVVGTVSVWTHGHHKDEAHVGVLGIHILPAWRGKGIGDELMREILLACRGKFEIVQLTVMGQNLRAQRLYLRHSFQECGREPRAIKRGDRYFDRVRMWRPVDKTPE